MSNEEPQTTDGKDVGDEASRSPVEDIDATPDGLKDAPVLEEEEGSPVSPENS